MPKARYLAPWQRRDVVAAVDAEGGERDREALEALRGRAAIYHCISRVVDRRFVFEGREKEKFVALMRLYEGFCQVRVLAFCVMSNHFHILLEVPAAPPERGRDWSDEQLLEHLSHLYSRREHAEIRWWLEHFRGQKNDAAAEELRESYFRRMWDLSQFMKSLKQCFTRWFNKVHDRHGTLWEERFKSLLVEGGEAAQVVAAYIDLNPVRADMVKNPKDYRWSSYGAAIRGNQRAREGIQRVMIGSGASRDGEEQAVEILSDWRAGVKRYREVLYASLRRGATEAGQGQPPRTAAEALGGRVRAFIDGLVFGSSEFVNRAFILTRDRFGPKRKDGARKVRGIETELKVMRDLA